MRIVSDPARMLQLAEEARREGKSIGLVPTMGALHEGHLSLVRRCRTENELAVMTLFVNPIQFDRRDDLARYPRDPDRDTALAQTAGADLIYAPAAEAMYPPGYATYVTVEGLTDRWEGATRPGHFRGVATVCTKLFAACRPYRAYFGQKDYQQALAIRRLVADLNLGLEIVVLPTVREADGLALSSRNALLTRQERRQAPVLSQALFAAQSAVRSGERDAETLRAGIEATIRTAESAVVDYVAVCDRDTLEPLVRIGRRAVALVAARFGSVRLIDNVLLDV
ncbi:MAG: pantoate--beta-alanine ligase [Zetaproteobacteria bacterium]|nr:MAG: pantoate--beta-alanine ligase [Zetaproteobacteria bacterium]